MTEQYNPLNHSIVQAMGGGAYGEYQATDFHEALLREIGREISRIHWNRYQKPWDTSEDDPEIPGIWWRNFRYDCPCLEVDSGGWSDERYHTEDCLRTKPNFQFETVTFNWYKHLGRGMSTNTSMDAEGWMRWFDRCIAKVRENDVR